MANRSPEEIAREIVGQKTFASAILHADDANRLVDLIADAIRRERETVSVSEEELDEIAQVAGYEDEYVANATIFKAGFRECAKRNAVARLDWPSEDAWMLELVKELKMHHPSEEIHVENLWRIAIYRLRALVGAL